eukprot:TRINITY_DN2006_c4_g1_i1.p1 TRINITY_DN2006_c4_g1~~TRINITY_DN2006_c4_g1_i1.p1  ORF type:complete len:387 (+),score=96.08 TRINITY_DN2006_c4_g1_i1:135-1295(+)
MSAMIVPVGRNTQQQVPSAPLQVSRPAKLQPAAPSAVIVPVTSGASDAATLRVRDPAVKGNVQYDVPADKISPTEGLRELLSQQPREPGSRPHCLCKLHVEGRCAQGSRCKSIHCDPAFILSARSGRNLHADDSFLSEVVIRDFDGSIRVVRYSSVQRTRGLEQHRQCRLAIRSDGAAALVAQPLCPLAHGGCPAGSDCCYIHLKPQQFPHPTATPCCLRHGDEEAAVLAGVARSLAIGGQTLALPRGSVAKTRGSIRLANIQLSDVCEPHLRTRCKYGRNCDRVHICREWANTHNVGEQVRALIAQRTSPPASPPPSTPPLRGCDSLKHSLQSLVEVGPIHSDHSDDSLMELRSAEGTDGSDSCWTASTHHGDEADDDMPELLDV